MEVGSLYHPDWWRFLVGFSKLLTVEFTTVLHILSVYSYSVSKVSKPKIISKN